jgi:hypothetical protein
VDTGVEQRHCQVERSLSAKLHDHPFRLLDIDDAGDIFQRQRLEIQTVGGIVIGADGLRVAVDHDGLKAVLFQPQTPWTQQ